MEQLFHKFRTETILASFFLPRILLFLWIERVRRKKSTTTKDRTSTSTKATRAVGSAASFNELATIKRLVTFGTEI